MKQKRWTQQSSSPLHDAPMHSGQSAYKLAAEAPVDEDLRPAGRDLMRAAATRPRLNHDLIRETAGPRGAEEASSAGQNGNGSGAARRAVFATARPQGPPCQCSEPSLRVRVRRALTQPPPIWVVKAPRASRASGTRKHGERQPRRRRPAPSSARTASTKDREARRVATTGSSSPSSSSQSSQSSMGSAACGLRGVTGVSGGPSPSGDSGRGALTGVRGGVVAPGTPDKGSERRAQVRRVDRTHGGGEGA